MNNKRYSVNICDMTQDLIISRFMLRDILTTEKVEVEKGKLDGFACLIKDDVPEDRILACRDIIRKKYSKNQFRIYCGTQRI